ncbi:T9SS type A sorting domain-containing protein [Flavobacterium silvisoli]|uniref:T9SS type A sorting domain-containing protein n=1 Tax=Flavobacterium silvisoli TaxID=2529433 RepID=A0A4Q9YX38_9FLAO|nr:T9SS type A sorting domain-containing protein [Flavobacterium silvisoli]TBX68375.1 T9SS type A sorting domain-containing protein [Flavobacterium silvisoli]
MKKTLLYLVLFLGCFTANAQFDCATDAVPIIENGLVSTPNTIDGIYAAGCFSDTVDSNGDPLYGIWYTFTPNANGEVTITSNLPQNVIPNSTDTRLSVFTGSCSNLICYKSNDDTSNTVYLSTLTFPVLSGVTYFIQWDSYFDNSGFDFNFTYTPVSCLKVYTVNAPTNLTDTTATLHWEASLSNPSQYEIEYGVAGFTPGTGTVVSSGTNSVILAGLEAGTIYDYYIRSGCDDTNFSAWTPVNKLIMAKGCPYYSGFDTDEQFAGWTSSGNGNGAYGLGTLSSQSQSPTKFWIFNTGTTGDMDNWLFTPPLFLQAGEAVTVSFWTRCLTSRNLRLTVGSDNTAAAQNTVVWSNSNLINNTYTQVSAPVWTAPQSGVYYFAFNDKTAAAATATLRLDTVNFSSTMLATNGHALTNAVVYPNPTHEVFTVLSQSSVAIENIEIIDLNGRIVKVFTPSEQQQQFSASDLAKGIYILKISSREGKTTCKMVKD